MIENDLEVFSLRVPRALGEEVKRMAEQSNRSRNGQIIVLLTEAVDLHKVRASKGAKEKAGTLRS